MKSAVKIAEKGNIRDKEDTKMCVVCFAKPCCIIFEPCCHVSVCEECSITFTNCPIDRREITLKKKVYLS
jgi:hypothetical protein